eukprot:15749050-Heterocapsa_arctica.AAC.1
MVQAIMAGSRSGLITATKSVGAPSTPSVMACEEDREECTSEGAAPPGGPSAVGGIVTIAWAPRI